MKELYINPWDFTLYDVNGDKIISVVFHNSFVDISRSFRLIGSEVELDFEGLKKLSEHIRNNYKLYKEREITPTL